MITKNFDWRKYLLEFLAIFIGISLAFALDKWNENRREIRSESKILTEMKHGLALDLQDVTENIKGHHAGIRSCNYFKTLIENEPVNLDSLQFHYFMLWRDFISIQNKTGYESLKSKGLELIRNDSLRFQIVEIYDFKFEIIEKLEEQYSEMQLNKSYFHPINDLLAEYMEFDKEGKLINIRQPILLSKKDKNRVFSFFYRMIGAREYRLRFYNNIKGEIEKLIQEIEKEL